MVGHAILLIGAQKIGARAFVFYNDSSDPSDPRDLSKQKIYIISYDNFLSSISDLDGILREYSDHTAGYAYHGVKPTI